MSGTDQIGLHFLHHFGTAAVHIQLKTVSQNRGLVRPFDYPIGFKHVMKEDVVPRKSHLFAVDMSCQKAVVLRLSGGEKDVEGVFLPLETLPIGEYAINANGLVKGAGGRSPGIGVGQHAGDRIEGEAPGPVVALQVGNSGRVIVVDMGRHDEVEGLDSPSPPEFLQVVFHKPHPIPQHPVIGSDLHMRRLAMPEVDEHGLSRVTEQDVKERTRPVSAPEEVPRDRYKFRIRKVESLQNGISARGKHIAAERKEIRQPHFEAIDVTFRIIDAFSVRREENCTFSARHRITSHRLASKEVAQSLNRLEGEQCPGHVSIAVLHGVQLIEQPSLPHEVPRKPNQPAVDCNQQGRRSLRVSLRRQNKEFIIAPDEGFVVVECGVNCNIAARGKEIVPAVVVVVDPPRLPEQLDLLEEMPLIFRDGNLRARLLQAWITPALIPVVVSMKDPFDSFYADPSQVIENRPRPGVDEQGFLSVDEDIDIAGVRKAV